MLKNLFCLSGVPTFCYFLKRRAPNNPEESSNEISEIMDMRPISIKNMNGFLRVSYQYVLQNIE